MTDEQLQRLRELASKATQPGPWTVREDFRGADERRCMVIDRDDMWVADCGNDEEQAAFIAAASPDVILALLDQLAEATAERDAMRDVCETAIEWKRVADDPGAPVWKYTMKLDAAIDAFAALRKVGHE